MIKGCKKRMIFIKDTKSDFFEEAYFILKGDVDYIDTTESDIVRAATMIINDIDAYKKPPAKQKKGFPKILFGMLLGASISAVIFGIISIFS